MALCELYVKPNVWQNKSSIFPEISFFPQHSVFFCGDYLLSLPCSNAEAFTAVTTFI